MTSFRNPVIRLLLALGVLWALSAQAGEPSPQEAPAPVPQEVTASLELEALAMDLADVESSPEPEGVPAPGAPGTVAP